MTTKHQGLGKAATLAVVSGWGANTAAILLRTANAGRLPLTSGYEFLIAFAWGIALFYLWFEYRYRLKQAALFILPVVWLLMAYVTVEMPAGKGVITPLMPVS